MQIIMDKIKESQDDKWTGQGKCQTIIFRWIEMEMQEDKESGEINSTGFIERIRKITEYKWRIFKIED